MKSLVFLLDYISAHKWNAILIIVLMACYTAGTLYLPLAFGNAIDTGIGTEDTGSLLKQINTNFLIVFAITIAIAILTSVQHYVNERSSEKVALSIREDFFGNLIHLDGRERDKLKSGDSVSRLTSDVQVINQFLTNVLAEGLATIVGTLGAVALMLTTNLQLGLILLAVVPVALIPLAIVGGSLGRHSEKVQHHLGEAGSVASETIDAIETVQAFHRHDLRHDEYRTALSKYYKSIMGMNLRHAIMTLIVAIIIFGGLNLVLWLGARSVANQTTTPGELTTLILYAIFAGAGFAQIGQIFGYTREAIGALSRLSDVQHKSKTRELIGKAYQQN